MQIAKIYSNQISAKGIVPKAKYSGTPRLSKESIEHINSVKLLIKNIEQAMSEVENNMSNPDVDKILYSYWYYKMHLLRKFKSNLQRQIEYVRRNNSFNTSLIDKIKNEYMLASSKLEKSFR